MKRWPAVASFVLFLLVCASAAYWAMQLIKPPVRPVAAPTVAANATLPSATAAAGLFGGRAGPTAVASNFQLVGVVMAGRPSESIAILSANGKPAQYVVANTEVQPGVTVKEVHRDYAVLSDHGVEKRVALPAEPKSTGGIERGATTAPVSMPRSSPAAPTTLVTPGASPSPSAPTENVPSAAPNVNGRGAVPPGMPQSPPPLPGQPGATMSGASSAGQTASGMESNGIPNEGRYAAPNAAVGAAPNGAASPGGVTGTGVNTGTAGTIGTSGMNGMSGTGGTSAVAGNSAPSGTAQAATPSAITSPRSAAQTSSASGTLVQPYQPFSTQPRQ